MHPETILDMADGSRKKAGAILVNDLVLGWNQSRVAFGRVKSVEWQDPESIYEITTCRGRKIQVTGQHPFLTMTRGRRHQDQTHQFEWQVARHLKINDRLKVALGWPEPDLETSTAEEAWALGAWSGDGDCSRFRFINPDPDIVVRLRSWIENLGSTLQSSYSTRQRMENKLYQYPIEHHIVGNGRGKKSPGREWIRLHFGQESRAKNKQVPAWVMQSNQAAWSAYLAGFLDTDGYVPKAIYSAVWTSESCALLSGCQTLLVLC